MLFSHLPFYRPCAVFADLLEWHRQARLGCGQFVFQFTPEEFALVVARAELAGLLASAGSTDGADARLDLMHQANGLAADLRRRRASPTRMEKNYGRRFVMLARRYGPAVATTLTEYAGARARWEADAERPAVPVLEEFADKLADTTESILDLLEFPLPNLEAPFDLPSAP
jgi:hypothetical protein